MSFVLYVKCEQGLTALHMSHCFEMYYTITKLLIKSFIANIRVKYTERTQRESLPKLV